MERRWKRREEGLVLRTGGTTEKSILKFVNGAGQGYSRPVHINSVVASEASWERPSGPSQDFTYTEDLIAYNIIPLDASSSKNVIVSFPECTFGFQERPHYGLLELSNLPIGINFEKSNLESLVNRHSSEGSPIPERAGANSPATI
ncbi:hypothetical protein Fmac_005280 [Flemingia macrophylla]|uniref:Uncharacterized protein n=1 Tax=Flemingia macrophylla TaxID=520843 RepID=A0ABD1N7A5_9FABA